MFNINIPSDLGTLQHSYFNRSSTSEKIAIVLQVYRDTEGSIDATPVQENIRRICEQYVNTAGVRLICVEHAETQLVPPRPDISLHDLVEGTSVSAAVQKVISAHPDTVEAWGVDNLDLINLSYNATSQLRESKKRQSRFFKYLCGFLYMAQVKHYSPELAELRRNTIRLYREGDYAVDLPLNKQAALINQIAEKINLDLHQFPVYYVFSTSTSQETALDFERIKAQREKFMARITQRAVMWIASVKAGHLEVDKEMTRLVTKIWMANTRLSQGELQYNLRLRGFPNVLLEVADWLETWLMESAIRLRLTGKGFGGQSEIDFYDMLAQLEQRHTSSAINLKDFNDYMMYRQSVDQGITPISLASELRECEKALIEGFNIPAAIRLSHIEDKLNQIYSSLQIEQNPLDAEVGDVGPGRLVETVHDLLDLLEQKQIPKDMRVDLEYFDQLLLPATEFPRLSRKRGQIMIKKTLGLLRSHREDRALLVIGGFHQRAVIHELEKHRQVSWELVIPKIDFDRQKQYKKSMQAWSDL